MTVVIAIRQSYSLKKNSGKKPSRNSVENDGRTNFYFFKIILIVERSKLWLLFQKGDF